MSQDFMDPELFADFIVEAKEHLETIEPNLLELEKAPDNLALLNEIFRPMHSLKGASGFLGLNRINHLAHKAENILDELRKGAMIVSSEIMDVILSATDALRQMIDNIEQTGAEGDVPIDHIGEQIDAIMAGEMQARKAVLAPVAPSFAVPEPETDGTIADSVETNFIETSVVETCCVNSAVAASAETTASVEPLATDTAPESQQSAIADDFSSDDWIATLSLLPGYVLTSFGEGHLKDFIDEAKENTERLSVLLLDLESDSAGNSELVNDLFRLFHNLKGNSGIIAFHELNSLTHEAETLLNKVRHGEMASSHELVDLLLLVIDTLDALINGIHPSSGEVSPPDITELLEQLKIATSGGVIAMPASYCQMQSARQPASVETAPQPCAEVVEPVAFPEASQPVAQQPVLAAGLADDDISVFCVTVGQQFEVLRNAIEQLRTSSDNKSAIDALYRSLVAIQNASNFMNFEEIKVYAERTASLVDTGRKADMDFGMMLDLLTQEIAIINELVEKAVSAPATGTTETHAIGAAAQAAALSPVVTSVAPAVASTPPSPERASRQAAPQATASMPDAKKVVPEVPKADVPKAPSAVASKPVVPSVTDRPAGASRPAPVAPARPATPARPGAAPAAAGTDSGSKSSSTIRVDHEKLDHLMNLIGELIINRNRYTMIAHDLEKSDDSIDIPQVAQSLTETTYAMARISDDLQDTIMKVRMVPVSSVFSRFPRLVRDLSRKSGKEVDLILEGEETELDKSVVEVIGDPLVHLIRNSVDHGIEPEAERIAKGKNPKGRVTLRAYHKGNSVAIEIDDDGKGIDPEKMRESAVRKGIITAEEAKNLDDRQAVELIFAPGFSTADKITDISGRGVGMDVVRTNVKNLKGSVSTFSEVGKGTRFVLSLPLTLAIIDALMVNVSGQMYAIPLDAVSETTKIEASQLTDIKGRKAVTLRGEVLGVMELAEMINLPRHELPEVLSVVVIHDNDRRLGFVVDRLLERQEIVIKPLGSYLGDLRGISGATIMGDGSVILILDPHEIYLMATSKAV